MKLCDIHIGDRLLWAYPDAPGESAPVTVCKIVGEIIKCTFDSGPIAGGYGEVEAFAHELMMRPREVTAGEAFVIRHIWHGKSLGRYVLLINSKAVEAWRACEDPGDAALTEFPTPEGGTHYGLNVRPRFVKAIEALETYDRVAHMLNQILPWTVIAELAPEVYNAWKVKMDKKEAATAENIRNRIANLNKKEIRDCTSNKSVSRFAREQRDLQR